MTFSSLNLEMKVGVCITCEESKSLPSLVGKVKKKFDPHLGMYYCGQKKWDINVIVLTFNVK
jgi:hypothetical protein